MRLPSYHVRCFAQDSEGTLWFGTQGGGLHRVVGQKIETFNTIHGLAGDVVQTLVVDRAGVLWVGTRSGLSRVVRRSAFGRSEPPRAGIRNEKTSTDAAGPLAGTDRGVHAAPSQISNNSLKRAEVRAPSATNSDSFEISSITTRHGLPDNQINQFVEDRSGNFWMSCRAGIFRARRADLEATLDGRSSSVEVFRMDDSDGLMTSETSNDSHPTGCVDGEGFVWFATRLGLVRIDPGFVQKNERSPAVFIEQLRAEEPRLAAPVGGSSTGLLRLPPGSGRQLELHFTALCFTAPEKVRFRYQLEGHNDKWIEAGNRRVAYYTNLKPGDYRFRVKACNNDGVWNESGAVLGFRIEPFYYQTGWFTATLAMVLLAGLSLAYRGRMRIITEQQRAEVTKVMHDRLAGKLSAIVKAGGDDGLSECTTDARDQRLASIATLAQAALAPGQGTMIRLSLHV